MCILYFKHPFKCNNDSGCRSVRYKDGAGFSVVKREKARARDLAFEIIFEIDAILFKCNYHTSDTLREKSKHKKMKPK